MTNPDYTAIFLLVDRSGSMQHIRLDAQGGINAFIEEQAKAEGKRTVRIAVFDDELKFKGVSIPAGDVEPFVLRPRGMTALLDAMGHSIAAFGEELATLPEDERPGNVVFAVMTDGQENASQEYTWEQLQHAVETQTRDYGWHILYLGANQDAIATAARMGIARSQSLTYEASSAGTRSVLGSLNRYTASAASGMAVASAGFTEEDREQAMDEQD